MVSIKSKMMDIILLRIEVTPYDGRDEPSDMTFHVNRDTCVFGFSIGKGIS